MIFVKTTFPHPHLFKTSSFEFGRENDPQICIAQQASTFLNNDSKDILSLSVSRMHILIPLPVTNYSLIVLYLLATYTRYEIMRHPLMVNIEINKKVVAFQKDTFMATKQKHQKLLL